MTFSPDRRKCEPCQNWNDIVNIDGECTECPEGLIPNGLRTECSFCEADQRIHYDDSCVTCPEGHVPSKDRKFCKACSNSLIADGGVCKLCPNPINQYFIKTEGIS